MVPLPEKPSTCPSQRRRPPKTLLSLAEERDVTVERECAPSSGLLRCDVSRLRPLLDMRAALRVVYCVTLTVRYAEEELVVGSAEDVPATIPELASNRDAAMYGSEMGGGDLVDEGERCDRGCSGFSSFDTGT